MKMRFGVPVLDSVAIESMVVAKSFYMWSGDDHALEGGAGDSKLELIQCMLEFVLYG